MHKKQIVCHVSSTFVCTHFSALDVEELKIKGLPLIVTVSLILLLSIQMFWQSQESKVAFQDLNAAGTCQEGRLQLVDEELDAAGSPGISAAPGSVATEFSGREPSANLPSSPAIGTRNILVI
ncbi:hypothetical protein MUP37_06940, partial [Candidatus Bathyarchaeota archaeon]|nr:hypothetical protein [Candidatus Bathyarchaeota archaeon]